MRANLRLAAILPCLLMAACVSQPSIHLPLSAAARTDMTSTDMVLPIRQSEIYVFVPMATAGASFGLIGALIDVGIDSSRTSKAETAVTPLRNALVDYSFDNALQDELKTSLPQVAWLHAGNVSVVRDVSNDGLAKTITASKASAVFLVVADYRLSNDGDVLFVTLQAALMPNNDQLRALIPGKRDEKTLAALNNALYRNRFVFEAHMHGGVDRDTNIAAWSANNGSAARAALTMAVKKLVPLLVEDVQRDPSDVAPTAGLAQVPVSTPVEVTECQYAPSDAQCGTTALLLRQDSDGEVFRFKDGSLKYYKTGQF